MERTYPLGDDSGRVMKVKLVACDSGGAASVTAARLNEALQGPKVSVTSNAYDFWRRLRDDPEGRQRHKHFHLLKGEPSRTAVSIHKTFPDSQQKDKYAIARGDVPVWAINSNPVKDQAFNMLGRSEPGGCVHMPVWFEEDGSPEDIDWLFKQLVAETWTPGGWKNTSKRKNEAFDLLAYCIAFLKHPDIRVDRIDWEKPPPWAAPLDVNDYVLRGDGSPVVAKPSAVKKSLADMAKEHG